MRPPMNGPAARFTLQLRLLWVIWAFSWPQLAPAQGEDAAAEAIRTKINEARAAKDFLAASVETGELVAYYRAQRQPTPQAAAWEENLAFLRTFNLVELAPQKRDLFILAQLRQISNLRSLYMD